MDLIISNLCKTYPGGVKALDNVSLTIPQGMFGLLGPNGAGKSTLMRTIATLQDADSGSIQLGDIDVLRDKDAVRRCLGYLPQEFGVYPRVSAWELLDHLAALKGLADRRVRKETIEALLVKVNLYESRAKAVSGFSGGMRQRFGIAQALIGDPRLLIVDEPTAGLDPGERNRFYNLLAEVGEKIIVILSTHIVQDVKELCSKMAVIDRGRVKLCEAPTAAEARLSGKIWTKSMDKHELAEARQQLQVISAKMNSGRHMVHVYSDQSPGSGFEPTTPDLEDVFFWHLMSTAA